MQRSVHLARARVSIKLPSAARRNARTPTEVAKASAAPVPAATILRGPSTAHRASGNGNGYSDDGSDKDDYRFLKDSFFSFCDDEIERLSSSPLGSSVKAAQEATEFSQRVTDALAATQRLLATKKGTSGDKTRDIDEARIQQLSIKAMKAVTVASWVAAAAAAAATKDSTAREDLQARASTVAGTAAGSCSQPTPNSTRPAMRKWRRMPRNANASAAAPPAGTTQTGERGIPTTAGTGSDVTHRLAVMVKHVVHHSDKAGSISAYLCIWFIACSPSRHRYLELLQSYRTDCVCR